MGHRLINLTRRFNNKITGSIKQGMVRVGHCRHRVYLEVLVRADAGCLLDWAPVSEAGLRVVEPLVAQVLHVVRINVADALGNL